MSASAGRVLLMGKGDYDATVTYTALDWVRYNGGAYVAKQTTKGNLPTNAIYWQLLVKEVSEMSGLLDVDITDVADGQSIIYDATNKKFKNGNLATKLASLSDVDIQIAADGDTLVYRASDQKWSNTLIRIVTWADGTDEEIAAMLEAHYNGDINIHDYWKVGDERTVHLSAMAATGVGESHVEQDVTMVLMNEGGKELVNPINGISECAFVVGQKDLLHNPKSNYSEDGYMNPTRTTQGGWDTCARRTWCNTIFYNALPETLRNIFKLHINKVSWSTEADTTLSNDYFSFPSSYEVFGTWDDTSGWPLEDAIQYEYYKTAANRIKRNAKEGDTWWNRNVGGETNQFMALLAGGDMWSFYADNGTGIAPHGVI